MQVPLSKSPLTLHSILNIVPEWLPSIMYLAAVVMSYDSLRIQAACSKVFELRALSSHLSAKHINKESVPLASRPYRIFDFSFFESPGAHITTCLSSASASWEAPGGNHSQCFKTKPFHPGLVGIYNAVIQIGCAHVRKAYFFLNCNNMRWAIGIFMMKKIYIYMYINV